MKKSPLQIDPRYQQVTRLEAASILGRSPSEFDVKRRTDPRCPKGMKMSGDKMAKVNFRLSDIYAYSELLMQEGLEFAEEASTKPLPIRKPKGGAPESSSS